MEPLRRLWRVLFGPRAPRAVAGPPDADPEVLPNPDGNVLAAEIETLQGILAELDSIAGSLPPDAVPIGLAARSLVEQSLAECRKPYVNARRVAEDMTRVGALATALRERLLLSPGTRPSLKN